MGVALACLKFKTWSLPGISPGLFGIESTIGDRGGLGAESSGGPGRRRGGACARAIFILGIQGEGRGVAGSIREAKAQDDGRILLESSFFAASMQHGRKGCGGCPGVGGYTPYTWRDPPAMSVPRPWDVSSLSRKARMAKPSRGAHPGDPRERDRGVGPKAVTSRLLLFDGMLEDLGSWGFLWDGKKIEGAEG